ncbi:hypothetical protein [Streptomyces sp. uw30]|nr:hypothetical protein [Streptomyces sp. uw30]
MTEPSISGGCEVTEPATVVTEPATAVTGSAVRCDRLRQSA